MDFDTIFTNYYSLYRGESTVPSSTDDEYIVAMRLANNAINRWANVDGVYWKELFTNLSDSTQVSPALVTTLSTGVTAYVAPTNMREAGGFVKVYNVDNTIKKTYPIIEPQEVQFKDPNADFCWFTGDPNNGFTMHLSTSPEAELNGLRFDYPYYKKATEFTTGTDKTEMANPWFICHHVLANRFRVSRNYGGYQTAMRDAEESLKNMQQDNNSGTWANPWSLADNSGTVWGI